MKVNCSDSLLYRKYSVLKVSKKGFGRKHWTCLKGEARKRKEEYEENVTLI